MRGDLQEGNGCASRCQFPLFLVPIPILSSTKSGFLCFFGVWNPRFRVFRAQNRGFCAFLAFVASVFGLFKHKIGIFVRFCPSKPQFSGVSSTKLAFLCQKGQFSSGFCPSRAQKVVFCARGWSSGKRLRDYGSRLFVISVPNGVQCVPNGVHSVPSCVQSVQLLVFTLLLKHPF